MDVKKLGRIPDGGGWRAHGRGCAPDRERKRGNGFDFVHSLVDDHSRLAYSEILPDEKGATCAGFLRRATDYFRTHGIAHIERLMTDNAWAYRYSLREVCADLGARQVSSNRTALAKRESRTPEPHPGNRMGLPLRCSPTMPTAPKRLHPGSSTTTLDDVTAHSAGYPPVSRLLPT